MWRYRSTECFTWGSWTLLRYVVENQKCWIDRAVIKVTFLSPDKLSPGQLWRGGSGVCRHTAGTDHHALGAGQANAGQSVPGNDGFFSSRSSVGSRRKKSWCLNLFCLSFFLRKGSRSTPTSSTPSTKLQTIGGSAASDTKSKIYTFRLGSKSPCRCRWANRRTKHRWFGLVHGLLRKTVSAFDSFVAVVHFVSSLNPQQLDGSVVIQLSPFDSNTLK